MRSCRLILLVRPYLLGRASCKLGALGTTQTLLMQVIALVLHSSNFKLWHIFNGFEQEFKYCEKYCERWASSKGCSFSINLCMLTKKLLFWGRSLLLLFFFFCHQRHTKLLHTPAGLPCLSVVAHWSAKWECFEILLLSSSMAVLKIRTLSYHSFVSFIPNPSS